jgi:hypothetical protein
MTWVWEQTGRMFSAKATLLSEGYSGANPEGINQPLKQAIPDVGPIPCGFYAIGAPVEDPETGPYTLPLTPDPKNEMYGRSEFKMHGDSIKNPGFASKGCIVLPLVAREMIGESNDHSLQVVPGASNALLSWHPV